MQQNTWHLRIRGWHMLKSLRGTWRASEPNFKRKESLGGLDVLGLEKPRKERRRQPSGRTASVGSCRLLPGQDWCLKQRGISYPGIKSDTQKIIFLFQKVAEGNRVDPRSQSQKTLRKASLVTNQSNHTKNWSYFNSCLYIT